MTALFWWAKGRRPLGPPNVCGICTRHAAQSCCILMRLRPHTRTCATSSSHLAAREGRRACNANIARLEKEEAGHPTGQENTSGPKVKFLKTTPIPTKNGSYRIKVRVHMPYFLFKSLHVKAFNAMRTLILWHVLGASYSLQIWGVGIVTIVSPQTPE